MPGTTFTSTPRTRTGRPPYHVNVGYLGVLPHLRGQGYVDELLAEITGIHAENGAAVITATTGTANSPMASAFERAGSRRTEIRMSYSASP